MIVLGFGAIWYAGLASWYTYEDRADVLVRTFPVYFYLFLEVESKDNEKED